MSTVVLLAPPEHHWVCPNCTVTKVTREQRPHTPFHPCRGLRGITAPFVPEGTRAKVVARDRDDFVNGEIVTTDADGRPVMAVETWRDDGKDCAVFPAVAQADLEDLR